MFCEAMSKWNGTRPLLFEKLAMSEHPSAMKFLVAPWLSCLVLIFWILVSCSMWICCTLVSSSTYHGQIFHRRGICYHHPWVGNAQMQSWCIWRLHV